MVTTTTVAISDPGMASYGNFPDVTSARSGHQVTPTTALFDQQLSDGSRHPQYPAPSVSNWQGLGQQGFASHPQQSLNTWRGPRGQGEQVEYLEDTSGDTTQAAAGEGQDFYDDSTSTHSKFDFSWRMPMANPLLSESHRPDTYSQEPAPRYPVLPDKSDQMRVRSVVSHGQRHSQEQHHALHRVARVGIKSQETTLLAASNSSESASQNLTQAASQALTSVSGRRTQVPGTSLQSRPEEIRISHAPQRSSAELTGNQPNTRPPSIQLQQHGPVSAKVTISSPATLKLSAAVQTVPVNSGNGSTIPRPNASRMASESTTITSTQAPTLYSRTNEYMPGYINQTRVFNPYHKDHKRRRNEATLASKAQDARAQLQSNALNRDIQARQAEETESDIAVEMKDMLDKMSVLRQKNPTIFQNLLLQTLRGEADNLADGSATSVVKSSFSESSQQAQVPALQKAVAASAHTAVKISSQVSQPKGLKQASYRTTDLRAGGRKDVVESRQEALPSVGHVSTPGLNLKANTTGRSPVNLTAFGGSSSQSSSTRGGYDSLGQPSNASTNVPATVPAIAVSGDDKLTKDIRTAVAKTAVEVLKSVPENNAVDITTSEIYSILEHNPPYIQLCDYLERKGFKLHRGHLARQLLASVPSLSKSNKGKGTAVSSSTPPVVPPPTATTTTPVPVAQPVPLVPADDHPVTSGSLASLTVAAPISGQGVAASSKARPSNSIKPESPKQVNRVRKKVPSVPPQHSPGPKEMLSRKRDFSELVDLTQLSDNDDYVLSNKHVQIESPPMGSNPLGKHQQVANMQHRLLEPKLQDLKDITDHPTDNITPRSGQPHKKNTILAKPINKIDAVRKRYYDPKTVARDILIAAGRHPHERPLNAHMAPLLDRYINIDSDLSTFDWDAIDPGGPPMPKVAPVDIPAAAPRIRMQWKWHAGHRKKRSQMGDEGDSSSRAVERDK